MRAKDHLPAWQSISNTVTDVQAYPYFVRLAVLANLLTRENERRRAIQREPAIEQTDGHKTSIGRLPKNSIKGLRAYFKLLALDQQEEPVAPMLKRTYLAFYAQLLEMKSTRPEAFEDFERSPELLIAKFLAIVSKLAGAQEVPTQGAQFVSLLRQIVRKQGGSSQLDAQLQANESQLKQTLTGKKNPPLPQEEVIPADCDGVAQQIANVMLVSPTLFARDLAQEEPKVSLAGLARSLDRAIAGLDTGMHPVYEPADFGAHWADFVRSESTVLQGMRRLLPAASETASNVVPPEVRSYFAVLLRHSIEYDRKAPTLFSAKTLQMLRFVARYWRVSAPVFASCLIAAINRLFSRDEIGAATVLDAFTYIESSSRPDTSAAFPSEGFHAAADGLARNDGLADTTQIAVDHIKRVLTQIFENPPKLGVFLQIIDTAAHLAGENFITEQHIGALESSLADAAETEYDRLVALLPRDDTLTMEHISNLVHAIISVAQKLQKKYKSRLLHRISIALVVCRVQLRLLSDDFMPLWQHCAQLYASRNEEPPFAVMATLHDELLLFKDLYSQVTSASRSLTLPPFPFDVEQILFPYFEKWATESAALAKQWVKPALDNDNDEPVDKAHGLLHTSAVKDLFRSFDSFVKLVDDLHWQNAQQAARLMTIVIENVSAALCDWGAHMQTSFNAEMDQSKLAETSTSAGLRAKEHDEEWLAYARETTAQARAALSTHTKPAAPPPFEFKRSCGAKINNVDAAYELLSDMETRLDADKVSRDLRQQKRSMKRRNANGSSHLFTVTIVSASDLKTAPETGVYVTLVDQDTRKQLGKTRSSYGSSGNSCFAAWNEPIELEVGKKPRLLKATVWSEGTQSKGNHVLCGRVLVRLDPKDFSDKEYDMQLTWLDLESGMGRLQVMVTVDALQDDIRFHFGKSLRFLSRVRESMITSVVDQFSEFIFQIISRNTLKQVVSGKTAQMTLATSVDKLQKSFNSWLGLMGQQQASAAAAQEQPPNTELLVEDSLNPLFDYLNRNFGIVAGVLTADLRKEVLAKTWDVVLEALELLIIPPLYSAKPSQSQLSSAEMEAVYAWLSCLRDFFYSEGAGPSLERLQNYTYMLIMAIPVYYDLSTEQLKAECEKIAKGNSKLVANNNELLARQRTVMAHRNKSVIEHQSAQLRNAQRAVPRLDDVILRILRLRDEAAFIDQHLRYRERLLQRELTEKALGGSF